MAILGAIFIGACSAHAQTDHSWAKVGASLFGNDEKDVLGSFEVGTEFNKSFRLQVGATASPFRTFSGPNGSFRYGGSDFEILGTYILHSVVPIELSLGLDQPRTPARTDLAVSYRAKAELPGAKGVKWWADAYGIAGVDSIAMAGLGARYRLHDDLHLEVSGALPVQGNNTVSPTHGDLERLGVYSIGLALTTHSGKQEGTLALAITNQVGWTTGMSATPTLGGYPGLNISFGVKF